MTTESEDDHDVEPVGSIERFLSLRQLSGRPVTVVDTEDEFYEACRKSLIVRCYLIENVPSPSLHPVQFGRNRTRYAF